jgi:hypothetical protein
LTRLEGPDLRRSPREYSGAAYFFLRTFFAFLAFFAFFTFFAMTTSDIVSANQNYSWCAGCSAYTAPTDAQVFATAAKQHNLLVIGGLSRS